MYSVWVAILLDHHSSTYSVSGFLEHIWLAVCSCYVETGEEISRKMKQVSIGSISVALEISP